MATRKERLTAHQIALVVRHATDGMSYPDIALRLGVLVSQIARQSWRWRRESADMAERLTAHREAINAAFTAGEPLRAIAEARGVSVEDVRTHIGRAIADGTLKRRKPAVTQARGAPRPEQKTPVRVVVMASASPALAGAVASLSRHMPHDHAVVAATAAFQRQAARVVAPTPPVRSAPVAGKGPYVIGRGHVRQDNGGPRT